MSKLATRLTELRTERNLTKRELGVEIGVSDVMIGYWERGRSEPSASNVIALADFFGISADYLLGRTDF